MEKDPERNEFRELLRAADLSGKRILEVGCGDGRLTWGYADRAHRVAAVDLDHDSLRVATVERPDDLERSVAFARADAIHLPFRENLFDAAILAWSF
jgi:ubiquinone/menaquinone biosynthesis C-methylase UbiE